MQKQVWLFMTAEDEAELVDRLAREAPLQRLAGPFFRGTVEELRRAPESLETRQLSSRETRTELLHRSLSTTLITHPVDDGPFAGWTRLDEAQSEVVTLVRPLPEPQGLGPGRLVVATHVWQGGSKRRKSPEFSRFASELLRLVAAEFPTTQYDWLHVAPHARAYAEGGGRLHYLYESVALAPSAGTPATTPHRGRG